MPLHGGAALPNDAVPFLAVGILSVDSGRYAYRRAEQRQTWVGDAHRLGDDYVYCRFTLRCGTWAMSPAYDTEALPREAPPGHGVPLSRDATEVDPLRPPHLRDPGGGSATRRTERRWQYYAD